MSQFKANVRSPHLKPPNYLYVGERKYNILLTRFRHNCSSLNSDLFNVNIIQYSYCSSGALTEKVSHFFFECPLYTQPRNLLLAQLIPNNIVTLDLLLNGNNLLDYDNNKMLYLQFYILLRAHVDSADAVLYCVELFSLMLVLLLYERAPALFESHFITFIVLLFFFHFFSLFIDVSSVMIVFNANYDKHSPLYPNNIIQSTLDVSNTVISKSFLLIRN